MSDEENATVSQRTERDAEQVVIPQANEANTVETAVALPTHAEAAGVAKAVASMPGRGNLDLLSGVELPVTLCFGRRRMKLRDVLELNAGSVVELDRQVEDPVELLLDGRVIARGEVVVVDGSYGLRVLEVVHGANNDLCAG